MQNRRFVLIPGDDEARLAFVPVVKVEALCAQRLPEQHGFIIEEERGTDLQEPGEG